MNIKRFFRSILNFVTFTDIPIWQKTLIFAVAGIGWFIIIAFIGILAVSFVANSSSELTDQIVPQIQTGQKAIIQMRGANVSVHNIIIHNDREVIINNVERARMLIDRASAVLSSLLKGGMIRDYSDLNGELIEEFYVHSIKTDREAEKYIKEAFNNNQQLKAILDEIVSVKLSISDLGDQGIEDTSLIMTKLQEYDSLTVGSVTALGKFTSHISARQKQYTERIKKVLSLAMILVVSFGVLAAALLSVFSVFLKTSITRPIRAITEQIKGLSEGEVNLTKQISVGSKDEIGELSTNFNILMQTIHDMNTFKKVIEEDDSLDDVYIRLANVFHENLLLDDITIYEVPNGKKTMRLIDSPYSRNEVSCNKEVLIDSELCRARKTGHSVSSIPYPGICKQFLLSPEKFHVCIPMIVGGSIGGVAQFQFDKSCVKENERPSPILDTSCIERQVLKAEQYIKESSAVIEAKRLTSALKESSVRDQMTGLYNRRFLEEYVETLIAGTMRKGGFLGLLMCDLDFFKEVNDKHGHDAGDTVLKETANVLAKTARASDMVIRFGGEEFLVILGDAKDGDAEAVAERIRNKIAGTKVKTTNQIIQKTISIGISEFPKDTQNFWEAIKYADIALYKAKGSGRNRTTRFTKEMWTEVAY